jgi:hypothetical protein
MFPTDEMKSRLSYMHQRTSPQIRERDHLHRHALSVTANLRSTIFNSGSTGCFAKPTEYCKRLAALLNDGTSLTTGNRILRPESVDEFFKNHIPNMPNLARQPIPDAKPELTNPILSYIHSCTINLRAGVLRAWSRLNQVQPDVELTLIGGRVFQM